MGVVIPQVITPSRASGAQVIDGSLKFDSTKNQYLKRSPGSAGNQKTYTYSTWVKRYPGTYTRLFGNYYTGNYIGIALDFRNDDKIEFHNYDGSSYVDQKVSNDVFRDNGWYHCVWVIDTTQSASEDKFKIYVNNRRITSWTTNTVGTSTNGNTYGNDTNEHRIGYNYVYGNQTLTNTYFIDGQALGPGYFGYTDPLTGTWRPKKFKAEGTTVNDGTTWSNFLTTNAGDNFDASGPKVDAFDGDSTDKCFTANNGDGTTQGTSYIQFNSPVVLRGYIDIYVDNGNAVYSVDSLGGLTLLGKNTSGSDNQRVDLGYVQTSKLRVLMEGGSRPAIGSISVDGVIMVDSTTQNLSYGTNGFHLPFDGSAPIGQDKSGNGNDWTPVNFGGSAALDKATGALPILNTVNGGNHATVGTRPVSEGFPNAVVNDGTVWSTATVSGDGSIDGSYPVANAFNGSLTGNNMRSSGTNTNITLTLPKSIPFTSSIRIYHNQNGTAKINSESTVSLTGGGANWATVYSGSGTFSSLTLTSTSGDTISLFAVEVDGEILVDGNGLVLALPLIGNANDVSNQINSASTTKTITANGNAAASSAQSNFYGGSYYFDGTGDYLSVSSTSDFAFGTGDFTLEYWINTSDTDFNLMHPDSSTGSGYWGHLIQTSSFNWNNAYNSTNLWNVNASPILDGEWHHCAICRSSGTTKVFFDGVSQPNTSGSFTDNTDYNGVDGWEIGGSGNLNDLTGYIQDLRVYKGVAKYTSNFIPASTSPDILPDTPSGVSGGSKLTKITDGAVSLDSDDYLSLGDSDDFNLVSSGTGDFTIEFYVYLPDISSRYVLSSGTDATRCYINGSTRLHLNNPTDSFLMESSTAAAAIKANKWTHIAFCKSSSTGYIFVDGIQYSFHSGPALGGDLDFNDLRIGRTSTSLNGFISNLRIIKGTALYTSNFTPPTRALTDVTNTKLLCCQKPTEAMIGFTTATASGALPILNTNDDGTSVTSGNRSDAYSSNLALALPLLNNTNDIHADIKGSGSNKTITTSGNIVASSDSSQLYGGSYIFDGSGYLEVSGTLFGSGPWTFECWLNLDDTGEPFLKVGSNTGATFNISNTSFQTDGDGVARLLYTGQNFGITPNTWFHFALVNDGTNRPIPYVNGIAATGSGDRGTAANTAPAGTLRLGDSRPAGGVLTPYNGYMQDVRLYDVVKYTGNFTPIGTFLRPQAAVSPGIITANGNAAATTFNPFNTDINTVRGQETGYCTWNPLISTVAVISNGNLDASNTNSTTRVVSPTIIPTTKCYWEVTVDTPRSGPIGGIHGVNSQGTRPDNSGGAGIYLASSANGGGIYVNGTKTIDQNSGGAAGDVASFAFDPSTRELIISLNGVTQATVTAPDTNELQPVSALNQNASIHVNFGQKPFKFPPPEGFQPLAAANVRPETVIARPNQYVGVTTYTGSGAARDIKLGIQPDFIWTKQRAGGSLSGTRIHELIDSVRGTEKALATSSTDDEFTSTGSVTSFNYDGYTIGSEDRVNENNATYVAWTWKAGGNKNTFNIDGVGYASASDVAMNVGGQNSNVYNTSQVWTNYSGDTTTKDPENVFDGDSSTNFGFPTSAGNGDSGTFTFSITGANTIRIRAYTGYVTTSNGGFSVNGVDIQSQITTTPQWITISGSSLSSITMEKGNAGTGNFDPVLEAVEVDGKILVDSTATPTNVPSIASSRCSVGTKQGFSIIGYTGTDNASDTISHGLSQKPDFAIFKNRSQDGDDWIVYHSSEGATKRGKLNLPNAFDAQTSQFNDTEPTSSLFTIGTFDNINKLSNNYISYIWHNVPGLQKFGTYEGGSNAFVELGFRPALVLFKNIDGSENWNIMDSTRDIINPMTKSIQPNLSNAEYTSEPGLDFLSNGFKCRGSFNTSATYIYAAWAEAPTVNLYGGGANAR